MDKWSVEAIQHSIDIYPSDYRLNYHIVYLKMEQYP